MKRPLSPGRNTNHDHRWPQRREHVVGRGARVCDADALELGGAGRSVAGGEGAVAVAFEGEDLCGALPAAGNGTPR
jgi:hypothetical protein